MASDGYSLKGECDSPIMVHIDLFSRNCIIVGVPTGTRTPVTGVKGRCPRPLDDRDAK